LQRKDIIVNSLSAIAWCRFACSFLMAWILASPAAKAAPPGADDYVRRPFIDKVAVSPAGTHLAMLMANAAGRIQVAVMDLVPLGPPAVLAGFDNANVVSVHWVNNDRLVFEAVNVDVPHSQVHARGLFAVNRDGKGGVRQLIAHDWEAISTAKTGIASRVLPWQWTFYGTVDDGSPDIIVAEYLLDDSRGLRGRLLSRLDTVTRTRRSLSEGVPDRALYWLLDGADQPRVVTSIHEGRATVHWREAAGKPWGAVAEFAAYGSEGFDPWFIDAQGQLLVRSRIGRDNSALYRFDPVQKKMDSEPLISLQGFDFNPSMVVDRATQRLLGVHFVTEQVGSYWFDKELRQIQQSIDAAMPKGRTNLLRCGRCAGARFFVVESMSDRQPGEYYLFDRQTLKLQLIGKSRPWFSEDAQGQRSFHRVAARDGLSLPVYLTRPASVPAGQALPAVVLVHGGPWMRGHSLRWSPSAQFLASRGYLVIEVEFRGSTGYGLRHFEAGWKQWGQAMQDDLADAVSWVAKQGLADARRVCIVGDSYSGHGYYDSYGGYGGYAALMGPIRHPGVYRCAASFGGMTDIDLMYSWTESDMPDEWKQYGLSLLVGDRESDAAQLRSVSPLQHAHLIKVPLLLAHGALDRWVPIEHSQKFRAAAESAGVKVEWVVYPLEAHGFRQQANEADYWKRVEAFLARSLEEAGQQKN
jgi:dipeptidyl aminopeptidase/acylaminoacyl peptidase